MPDAPIVGTPHRVPLSNRDAAKSTLRADITAVLEYVSRGRSYVDCTPYPDFQARRALAALMDEPAAVPSSPRQEG